MNIAGKSLLILAALYGFSFAGYDVVFMGLHGEGAPAVEKTYERLLQEQLAVLPGINAVDYIQSQKYAHLINFKDYPVVSNSMVEALEPIAGESILFVWGTVKEYKITTHRKLFFWVKLKGELTIGLNMYSLARRSYIYSGDVKAETIKSKGMTGFGSIEKNVHISALDRAEILEKLENEAVKGSVKMISALCRAGTSNAEEQKNEEPSMSDIVNTGLDSTVISDLSNVPGIEAPGVESDSGSLQQGRGASGSGSRDSAATIPDTTNRQR